MDVSCFLTCCLHVTAIHWKHQSGPTWLMFQSLLKWLQRHTKAPLSAKQDLANVCVCVCGVRVRTPKCICEYVSAHRGTVLSGSIWHQKQPTPAAMDTGQMVIHTHTHTHTYTPYQTTTDKHITYSIVLNSFLPFWLFLHSWRVKLYFYLLCQVFISTIQYTHITHINLIFWTSSKVWVTIICESTSISTTRLNWLLFSIRWRCTSLTTSTVSFSHLLVTVF